MTPEDRPPDDVPLTTTYGVVPPPPPASTQTPPPPPPADEPRTYIGGPEGPRMSRNKMIAAGVAGAVALGLLFGLALGPSFKDDEPKLERVAAGEAADRQVQIEVSTRQAPAPKLPAGGGKLDAAGTVIQPTGAPARAERKDGGLFGALGRMLGGGDDRASPPEIRPAPVRERRSEPRAIPAPVVVAERDDEPEIFVREEAPRPRAVPVSRPSFDCRYARSRSERMVCEEPRLAAVDRRLAAAYRNAVDAGVPQRALRAQQDRWLAARERAAVSPEAVHMVYEQRIAELEDMSEGDGGW